LFNTTCTRCDCCDCCGRGLADGDGDGCGTTCVFFSACEASGGGGNISCGLGLLGDSGLAIGAGRVVLEEFGAAFGRLDVDSYGVLVVRWSDGCCSGGAIVCGVYRLEGFVADIAILVVIIHIVRVSALVVTLRAVVEMAIVADCAFLGHLGWHGLVTWVGFPAGERSGAGLGSFGGIGTAGLGWVGTARWLEVGSASLHHRGR
jgi:hypothetical protein